MAYEAISALVGLDLYKNKAMYTIQVVGYEVEYSTVLIKIIWNYFLLLLSLSLK